jgi:hypothetical protein
MAAWEKRFLSTLPGVLAHHEGERRDQRGVQDVIV